MHCYRKNDVLLRNANTSSPNIKKNDYCCTSSRTAQVWRLVDQFTFVTIEKSPIVVGLMANNN
jgi:hypothetical protein